MAQIVPAGRHAPAVRSGCTAVAHVPSVRRRVRGCPAMRVAVVLEQCWHRVPGARPSPRSSQVDAVAATRRGRPGRAWPPATAGPPPEALAAVDPGPPPAAARRPCTSRGTGCGWPAVERATGPGRRHPRHRVRHPAAAPRPWWSPCTTCAWRRDPRRSPATACGSSRPALRCVLDDADLVLCPSQATLDDCVAAGHRTPTRLRLVPWGMTTADVAADAGRPRSAQRYGIDRPLRAVRSARSSPARTCAACSRRSPGCRTTTSRSSSSGPRAGATPSRREADRARRSACGCTGFVPRRRARRRSTRGVGHLLPEPVGGLRPAGGRGHGAGRAGRHVDGHGHRGAGRRGRGPGGRPDDVDAIAERARRGPRRRRRWPSRLRAARAARRAAATHVGGTPPRPTSRGVPRRCVGRPDACRRATCCGWCPGVVGGTRGVHGRPAARDRWPTPPGRHRAACSSRSTSFADAHPDLVERVPDRGWRRLSGRLKAAAGGGREHLAGPGTRRTTSTSSTTWAARCRWCRRVPGHRHHPRPAALRHARELHAGQAALPAAARSPRSVRRGRGWSIAPTEFVRRRHRRPLRRRRPSGVRLAPPGRRRRRRPEVTRRPRSSARYGLPRRWFVYPAITYPHKNHDMLVRAFARVAGRRARRDAGAHRRRGAGRGRGARRRSTGLGLRDRVRRTGRIPRRDLLAVVRGATALTFPSRYEGFGLPGARGDEPRHARASPPTPPRCPRWWATPAVLRRPRRPRRLGDGHDCEAARATAHERARPAPRRVGRELRHVHAGDDRRRPRSTPTARRSRAAATRGERRGSDREPARPLPALRARRRAHRRGDDQHRHRAGRPGPPAARRHRRCPGTSTTASSRAGTGRLVAPRGHRRGAASPGSTRSPPTSATSRPGPLAFAGFTVLAALRWRGRRGRRRPDAVLAMSPPLTLGVAGWPAARRWRVPFVFNIQDVFPDVAVELGRHHQPAGDRARPRGSSAGATGGPTRSPCCPTTCATTSWPRSRATVPDADDRIRVIPNFVDTDRDPPGDPEDEQLPARARPGRQAGRDVRRQRRLLPVARPGARRGASALADTARRRVRHQRRRLGPAELEDAGRRASPTCASSTSSPRSGCPRCWPRPTSTWCRCERGLARSSVPSKTYSILAAGRPVVASVDEGTEVARVVERAGAGLAVPPDDPEAFTQAAGHRCSTTPSGGPAMGRGPAGRSSRRWASPAAVAERYEALFDELRSPRRRLTGCQPSARRTRGTVAPYGQGILIEEGRARRTCRRPSIGQPAAQPRCSPAPSA